MPATARTSSGQFARSARGPMPAFNKHIRIDGQKIVSGLAQAVERAMNKTLNEMFVMAVEKAPVRKVFKGGRERFRFATLEETELARRAVRQIGKSRDQMITPRFIPAPPGFTGSPNSREGKQFYRIREDKSSPLRNYRDRTGREFSKLNPQKPTGRNRANDLIPKLTIQSGSRRGQRVRGDFREYANPFQDSAPGKLRHRIAEENLTSRGKYEVRTRRAQHIFTAGGALRNSIRVDPAQIVIATGGKVSVRGRLLAGSRKVPYARYVELGTSKMAARPFLIPALHAAREVFRARVIAEMKKSVAVQKSRAMQPDEELSEVGAFLKKIGAA